MRGACLNLRRLLFILPFVGLLAGCSVYRSQGRQFLESNGLQPFGSNNFAASNVVDCNREQTTAAWVMLQKTQNAEIFALEGEDYQMRVNPMIDDSFNCYFRFSSAQEMYQKTGAAVDLTLAELNSAPKTR